MNSDPLTNNKYTMWNQKKVDQNQEREISGVDPLGRGLRGCLPMVIRCLKMRQTGSDTEFLIEILFISMVNWEIKTPVVKKKNVLPSQHKM